MGGGMGGDSWVASGGKLLLAKRDLSFHSKSSHEVSQGQP